MLKIAKYIVKYRVVILILAILLLIPCSLGYLKTRINYDILSYLPNTLETVSGQDTMVEEFGMGAFSMVVVEDMPKKDVAQLEKDLEDIDHVADVLWYDDALDISIPEEMLPSDLRKAFFNGDATMMVALFDDTTSADSTMDAIEEMRKVVKKDVYISGMSAVVTDIKEIVESEMFIYVAIAVILTLLILLCIMDSFATPVIFLLNIGMAVVYNMGSNFFLNDVSYLTQALAAIMQLACTMDYSIFLLDSYREYKVKYNNDKQRSMAHAVANTFTAVSASSLTTVAGFAALLAMTFKLGANIGIVMMKGVVIGVLSTVIVLPGLILMCDRLIEKTTHKPLLGNMSKVSGFIVKHRYVALVLFGIIMVPAIYGGSHYKVYYNIAKSLPSDLPSAVANDQLDEKFNMSTMHIVLLKGDMSVKNKNKLMDEMEDVKGVQWVLGLSSVLGPNIPEDVVPMELTSKLKSENYEIMFISSDYQPATDIMNEQVASLNKIVKKYSEESTIIGESPLMKDLEDLSTVDHKKVNIISIGAIFLIILFTFKSISLPVLLVAVIELAIYINMSIAYFSNTELAFIAGTVIGTVQLGSTVDYAILMTSYYHKARAVEKLNKKDAVLKAHSLSMPSILTSGLCFFGATIGVAIYSDIDIIKQLCTLLARGALISMIVVICLLPSILVVFDPVIIRTSLDMRRAGIIKKKHRRKSTDAIV